MKQVGLLTVTFVALLLCGPVRADRTIWYVHPDSALNTIQMGLDSCADNDIVLVGPGTYYENIVWPNTQGIHLISELGPDVTIIDGDSAGTVIACTTDIDTTTIIRSFTVRNGYIDTLDVGGIVCHLASPTISDNAVTNNNWGILVSEAAPTIVRNTITTNTTGIFTHGPAIIDTNIIEFNTGSGIHGGVYSIRNNIIRHNGGGVTFHGDWWHFTDNTISHNTSHGVCVSPDPGSVDCRNERSSGGNVISHNGGYGIGGVMAVGYKHSVITYNGLGGILHHWGGSIDSCTIAHNYGPGVTFGTALGTLYVNYCNIFDNAGFGILNLLNKDTIMVNAENIWWGDASGPYHPTLNPGGLGDTVSDYVDFDPWLYNPWGIEEEPIVKPIEKHGNLTATIFRGPLRLPEGKEYKVFDITGRVVAHDKLRPGIYFIEVDDVVTQKLVKVR